MMPEAVTATPCCLRIPALPLHTSLSFKVLLFALILVFLSCLDCFLLRHFRSARHELAALPTGPSPPSADLIPPAATPDMTLIRPNALPGECP